MSEYGRIFSLAGEQSGRCQHHQCRMCMGIGIHLESHGVRFVFWQWILALLRPTTRSHLSKVVSVLALATIENPPTDRLGYPFHNNIMCVCVICAAEISPYSSRLFSLVVQKRR
jgi:hypothetical protein